MISYAHYHIYRAIQYRHEEALAVACLEAWPSWLTSAARIYPESKPEKENHIVQNHGVVSMACRLPMDYISSKKLTVGISRSRVFNFRARSTSMSSLRRLSCHAGQGNGPALLQSRLCEWLLSFQWKFFAKEARKWTASRGQGHISRAWFRLVYGPALVWSVVRSLFEE